MKRSLCDSWFSTEVEEVEPQRGENKPARGNALGIGVEDIIEP